MNSVGIVLTQTTTSKNQTFDWDCIIFNHVANFTTASVTWGWQLLGIFALVYLKLNIIWFSIAVLVMPLFYTNQESEYLDYDACAYYQIYFICITKWESKQWDAEAWRASDGQRLVRYPLHDDCLLRDLHRTDMAPQ